MGIKWNSRKVVFGLLLLLVGVAVEIVGPRGLTEVTAAFLVAIGASYFAGNVGDKIAGAKQVANAPSIDADSIISGVKAINDKLDAIGINGQSEREGYLKALAGILAKTDDINKKTDYIIKKGVDG